jgi:hypothetical protein
MDSFRAYGNLNKLTTAKGATWEIKSDTVKLRDHVVHTVTITGVVSNATTHGNYEERTYNRSVNIKQSYLLRIRRS